MRHLAIGDIHGCLTALAALADFVPFRPDDRLITLGDYVNRGPDVCGVLYWLMNWKRAHQLVPLRGNHELMMLAARDSREDFRRFLEVGGEATLASYSPFGDRGRLVDVPDVHWDFLDGETLPYYETDTHFFVHANAYPDIPLEEQPDFMLYWERFDDPPPHDNGKIMVCGHTSQRSGLPLNLGHAVCIDTRVYAKGWLTCLDVGTGRYWQANQQGETRIGQLDTL